MAPGAGTRPIGVSTASPRPCTRSTTHLSTRLFSPKPGPQELAVLALAEPVHPEQLRQLRALALADLEPVLEVVAHVVAAEREHREGVEAELADGAGLGGGGLGAHDRAEEHAVLPVEALGDERDVGGAAAAEEDRRDRHALRVLPLGGDRRALRRPAR